jgi:hypothetical protein
MLVEACGDVEHRVHQLTLRYGIVFDDRSDLTWRIACTGSRRSTFYKHRPPIEARLSLQYAVW